MNALTLVAPAAPAAPAVAATAAAPATPRRTLFQIEETLQALVDSTELVAAEQEQEFIRDLQAAMLTAKDKRDRVGAFIVQCEGQAMIAAAEIARLKKRQTFFEAAVERLEGYVLHAVLHQAPDAKGKYPKMEGNTSSFAAQRNPPSVIITDETTVPQSCKTISVTMPAPMWDTVLDSLDLDFSAQLLGAIGRPTAAIVKAQVKEAIVGAVPDWKEQLTGRPSVYCEEVPGAAIGAGAWRLVRT